MTELLSKNDIVTALQKNNKHNVIRQNNYTQELGVFHKTHQDLLRQQINENKNQAKSYFLVDRAEHIRDLKVQEQMHKLRQDGLDAHLYQIQARDEMINQYFEKDNMVTQAKLEV